MCRDVQDCKDVFEWHPISVPKTEFFDYKFINGGEEAQELEEGRRGVEIESYVL